LKKNMPEGASASWSDVVAKHHSALVGELTACLDSEVQSAVSRAVADERVHFSRRLEEAGDEARRSRSEALNQALRRFRNLHRKEEILRLLGECCGSFADRLVVLSFENSQARAIASKGIGGDIVFDTETAAAVVGAIESQDPVVAKSSPDQLSEPLAAAFAAGRTDGENSQAYLFPVVSRHSVHAMLVAEGAVESAPIELVSGAAAMRLEALTPPESLPGASPIRELSSRSPSGRWLWDELTPEDQKLHLQAQRAARVRVATMRLDLEEALNRGTADRNIYGALRSDIDAARQEFLNGFLSQSPTMVDYLHLEILRTLAHGDEQLLGTDYPGPMV
jgi:hypothetical protein